MTIGYLARMARICGRELGGLFVRNGVRHGGADPQRAFVEMRHEFAADEGDEQQGRAKNEAGDKHGQSSDCPGTT